MKIATLLFTYKRSWHTEQVINALKKNTVLPQKLFVFQDGLKKDEDKTEWNKVNRLIKNIDWCDTEIMVSECNKGLAVSIVSGITYVFEKYDAIIVLEDDCVPEISFMGFMQQCFEKYRDSKTVYSVSGYAYPISLKQADSDIYGCGRISSWGWGTWKDRWEYFEKDYELVRKLKQNKASSQNLAMWGMDLESMLVGNIRGECDSWAVFWALNVIAQNGICVNPYESLIKNIGLDGTGENCGVTDQFNTKLMGVEKKIFDLPDEIEIADDTIKAFASLYGSYTAINFDEKAKEKILVYGLGNFYLRNEQKICEEYHVKAFIDRGKHGWFAGKQIIKKEEIDKYTYDRILVMIQNGKDCLDVEKQLIAAQIDPEKIWIGHNLYK